MKSLHWIAALSAALLLVPLSAQAPSPQASSRPGIAAPWDISQTVAALNVQVSGLEPLLRQITPREWLQQGAPEAYVAQWQSAQKELADVETVAQSLQKQPDRLTLALDAYFRLQSLETRLITLVDGVRQYQNPALGDLVVAAIGESATNRDQLRDYISDLAAQKEQEFTVVDKEAQRCRTTLNRQPAPAAPRNKK